MSDDDDERPWVCEFCKGKSGKPRASSRARSCTSNSKKFPCRDMLAAARAEAQEERGRGARLKRARAAVEEQPAGFSALIAQKRCFKIYEVYGVSFFDLTSIAADDGLLRNGIDGDEREYQYLIRGGFGKEAQRMVDVSSIGDKVGSMVKQQTPRRRVSHRVGVEPDAVKVAPPP